MIFSMSTRVSPVAQPPSTLPMVGVDDHAGRGARVVRGVEAAAAVDDVGAIARNDGVGAVAAIHGAAAKTLVEHVVAVEALQQVVAVVAFENVGGVVAADRCRRSRRRSRFRSRRRWRWCSRRGWLFQSPHRSHSSACRRRSPNCRAWRPADRWSRARFRHRRLRRRRTCPRCRSNRSRRRWCRATNTYRFRCWLTWRRRRTGSRRCRRPSGRRQRSRDRPASSDAARSRQARSAHRRNIG